MLISVELPRVDLTALADLPADWDPEDGYALLQPQWSEEEHAMAAPPPDITVSEWADANRVLQAGVSRNPGPWNTDYTPYLRPIMDAYNLPHLRHLVFCAGTQLGKTEALYNILGYIIAHDPYSTLLMYPREDDAKGVSRVRLQPMIEDCEALRARKPERAGLYQTLEMHFPGMVLYLVGANSLAALAQKPCRNVLRDEIDKFPDQLGDDADPKSKSEERAKSFWDIRKVVDVSSPTVAHKGILRELEGCNQVYRIHHPCPHCRALLLLTFKQLKWDDRPGDPDRIVIAKRSAHYVCPECGGVIDNGDRPWMIANFQYLPDRQLDYLPEAIGFWVSSLSSPMLTWGDIAEAFLKAERTRDDKGDTTELQNFVNDWLAEAWTITAKQSTTERILSRRCDLPPLVVPAEAVALTCGIDVQKFGFWFTVWAWTRECRSWLVHYGFLASWDDVWQLLFATSFEVQGSAHAMAIWRAGMDIGGGEGSEWGDDWTKTEEIVTWIRNNGQGVVAPVKGMSVNKTGQKIKPSVMDKMPGGRGGIIPGGLTLWLIDTAQMKDTLFWRLGNLDTDPQPLHLHRDTGDDFALQLLAEEKKQQRNGDWVWVQVKRDNHLLDASVYAHACADFQWMGGVNILSDPQYLAGRIGAASRGATEETTGLAGDAVRNFRRPEWLANRRR
jgi:phage terminase large subunit GpA-like protein